MRSRAFTLVELLVVIGILALLTALSSVVLMGSRERARTVACCANIRHVALSLYQYDSDHGSLPYGFELPLPGVPQAIPPGGFIGNGGRHVPGWWWFHYTGAIRNRSREELKLLQCPAKRLEDPQLQKDPLCGNYGVNRSLCKSNWASPGFSVESFVGTPLSLGGLARPGSTLLVVDCGYSLACWWHATAEPPVQLKGIYPDDVAYIPGLEINTDKIVWPGQSCDAKHGRHPNKTVNVGFADGHAETKRAGELLMTKTESGGYTNTVLWHDGMQVSPSSNP
jgi:prepilin-type processing-associated H-X9-DG protein/prepilin-type N-terminal cleavage/methylation domain-containing protein